jgi:hypothetical protein
VVDTSVREATFQIAVRRSPTRPRPAPTTSRAAPRASVAARRHPAGAHACVELARRAGQRQAGDQRDRAATPGRHLRPVARASTWMLIVAGLIATTRIARRTPSPTVTGV